MYIMYYAVDKSMPKLVIFCAQSDLICRAEMTLTDGNTDESITLLNSDLTIMLTNVSFTSEKLMINRKYRIMVNASNINGSSVFSGDISMSYSDARDYISLSSLNRFT